MELVITDEVYINPEEVLVDFHFGQQTDCLFDTLTRITNTISKNAKSQNHLEDQFNTLKLFVETNVGKLTRITTATDDGTRTMREQLVKMQEEVKVLKEQMLRKDDFDRDMGKLRTLVQPCVNFVEDLAMQKSYHLDIYFRDSLAKEIGPNYLRPMMKEVEGKVASAIDIQDNIMRSYVLDQMDAVHQSTSQQFERFEIQMSEFREQLTAIELEHQNSKDDIKETSKELAVSVESKLVFLQEAWDKQSAKVKSELDMLDQRHKKIVEMLGFRETVPGRADSFAAGGGGVPPGPMQIGRMSSFRSGNERSPTPPLSASGQNQMAQLQTQRISPSSQVSDAQMDNSQRLAFGNNGAGGNNAPSGEFWPDGGAGWTTPRARNGTASLSETGAFPTEDAFKAARAMSPSAVGGAFSDVPMVPTQFAGEEEPLDDDQQAILALAESGMPPQLLASLNPSSSFRGMAQPGRASFAAGTQFVGASPTSQEGGRGGVRLIARGKSIAQASDPSQGTGIFGTQVFQNLINFLNGRTDDIVKGLEKKLQGQIQFVAKRVEQQLADKIDMSTAKALLPNTKDTAVYQHIEKINEQIENLRKRKTEQAMFLSTMSLKAEKQQLDTKADKHFVISMQSQMEYKMNEVSSGVVMVQTAVKKFENQLKAMADGMADHGMLIVPYGAKKGGQDGGAGVVSPLGSDFVYNGTVPSHFPEGYQGVGANGGTISPLLSGGNPIRDTEGTQFREQGTKSLPKRPMGGSAPTHAKRSSTDATGTITLPATSSGLRTGAPPPSGRIQGGGGKPSSDLPALHEVVFEMSDTKFGSHKQRAEKEGKPLVAPRPPSSK